jgi:hypothetical protein
VHRAFGKSDGRLEDGWCLVRAGSVSSRGVGTVGCDEGVGETERPICVRTWVLDRCGSAWF